MDTSLDQFPPPATQLTPNNASHHRPPLPKDPQATQQLAKSLFGFTGAGKCDRSGFCRRARDLRVPVDAGRPVDGVRQANSLGPVDIKTLIELGICSLNKFGYSN
ncbi:hypothetical protein NG798_20770 [Ancylothrix sp. C2]|uniref:hypothetical protein n=1 Tax=Ancylothrix sp. D3o TaxID=2953691 RepID=UPI0021BA42A6|nr:hypothetical protein [Ancylothrix sp. D3o]MCT7952235.1 hypothetical protein [Ancylothrix sp. D3o]